MRISNFFYLALACIVLSWAACEDEEMMQECSFATPTLAVTDQGICDPILLRFGNLSVPPAITQPVLPLDCQTANPLGRQAEILITGSNSLDLHIYNGTRGIVFLQVFGATNCTQDLTPITNCREITDAASILALNGLSAFDNVFVRLDFTEPDGGTFSPEADDFVSLAAYEDSPVGQEVEYGGINPDATQNRLLRGCDGTTFQRLVMFSCDPGANLDAWVNETGLNRTEEYVGDGGQATAVDVPPGLDPNTAGPAVARKRLDRNNDDFIVEEDHIIQVTSDGGIPGALPDAIDLVPQDQTIIMDCLVYELGESSSEDADPGSQMVVTMIDSGIEIEGDYDGDGKSDWDNHRNRAFQDGFLQIDEFGFDFFHGDNVPDDEIGHGTNTAGAVIGNYLGGQPLTVVHHKIFGPEGQSTYFGALVALLSAADINSDVINCSWGYKDDVRPRAMECVIAHAVNQGIVVVTSAGNDLDDITPGTGAPQWPASFGKDYQLVYAVASYQYSESPDASEGPILSPAFSNFGSIGNPVVRIAGYLTAKTPRFGTNDFNFRAGTSISAPLVSSAIATSLANTSELIEFEDSNRESSFFEGLVFENNYLPVCPEDFIR